MALVLSRTIRWPLPTTNSCAPASLFQPSPWVGHHHQDSPSLQWQARRRHRFSSSATSRRIFSVRLNSSNAEGECPDSSVDHKDAAFGTAGIDDHDRPSARTPGSVLSASWQGGSRGVGLEGAATTGPSGRVGFSTEHVQPQDNTQNAPSEKPRTTTTAAAVVAAGVNGKGRLCNPEIDSSNGFSFQPAQPGQQQGNGYEVLSELLEVGDEQTGEAGEPTTQPASKEGESTDLDAGAFAESYERGKWLLGLLVLQSTSSSVLDKYQVRTGTSKQLSEFCLQKREQGWGRGAGGGGLARWRVRCAKILGRLPKPHGLDIGSRDHYYS